jgi:adenosylhomocysteine nucleosidase
LDAQCLLAVSGAGPEAAARAAASLAEAGAEALISWGCAAALAPELAPGDLVLAEYILAADGEVLQASPHWRHCLHDIAAGAGLRVHDGLLAESASIVATAAAKHSLHAASHAIAVDMESAAVARAALYLHLPFLAVRAIADPAAMAIPQAVLRAMDAQGKVSVPRLLAYALLHPTEFIGLLHLGRYFSAAMKTLRQTSALSRALHFGLPASGVAESAPKLLIPET